MGAFDQIYRRGIEGEAGSPLGYAIHALKAELNYNHHGSGLNLQGLMFGEGMDHQTRVWQGQHSLAVDGEIGPITALSLYQPRIGSIETSSGVPDGMLCKMAQLESVCDPGAVGVADPNDHGICQINALAHPEVSLVQAFTPAYSLNYMARALVAAFRSTGDWDCAVASWNIGGGGASVWCAAGKPTTLQAFGLDIGARATRYVQMAKERTC